MAQTYDNDWLFRPALLLAGIVGAVACTVLIARGAAQGNYNSANEVFAATLGVLIYGACLGLVLWYWRIMPGRYLVRLALSLLAIFLLAAFAHVPFALMLLGNPALGSFVSSSCGGLAALFSYLAVSYFCRPLEVPTPTLIVFSAICGVGVLCGTASYQVKEPVNLHQLHETVGLLSYSTVPWQVIFPLGLLFIRPARRPGPPPAVSLS